jgi:uncharacterized SAM-binding protein YcdF (DUF218 family)
MCERAAMGFKKFALIVTAVVLVSSSAVALLPNIFLEPIGSFLVVREEPRTADAIVVLLGESRHERTELARTLYNRGLAPILVFPETYRRAPLGWWGDVEQFPLEDAGSDYRKWLEANGVPSSAIRTFLNDDIHDTSTELKADAEYLRQQKVRSVILVSSASHSRRVSIIWNRVAPDIPSRTIGSPDSQFEQWWLSKRHRRLVLYEYGALVKELLRRMRAVMLETTGCC